MSYNELNAYYEQIANRSTTYRGQAVAGNLTNTNGVQPGSSQTVAGGQQVIQHSSNIDGKSQLDTPFAVVNIPDDPRAYISSDQSEILGRLTGSGLATGGFNVAAESHTQFAGTSSGLQTISLNNTSVTAINSVFSGATIYPPSGTVPNASGAGYSLSGNSLVWNNGTYPSYVAPMASGWVAPSTDTFFVNYNYGSGVAIVVTNNIPASVPVGKQQAVLGNAGQTTQAGSSFGGYDITR